MLDPVLLAGSGQPAHPLPALVPAGAVARRWTAGCWSSGVIRATVVPAVARQVGAAEVHISADYMPYGRRRDEAVRTALGDIAADRHRLAVRGRTRPGHARTAAATTPSTRRSSGPGAITATAAPPAPEPGVEFLRRRPAWTCDDRVAVDDLDGVSGDRSGAAGRAVRRTRGDRWATFRDERLADYRTERNRPDRAGTSRLSAYLKYGCIHPRTLLADLKEHPSEGAVDLPAGAGLAGLLRRPGLAPPAVGVALRRPGRRQAAVRQRAGRRAAPRRPGRPAGPATRTSTPRCGSCWPRAGSTTGPGWASRRS